MVSTQKKQAKIEDESSFGRQVAVEVSHIKDPTLKTRAKKKIMTTLYDSQEADQERTGRAQANDQLNICFSGVGRRRPVMTLSGQSVADVLTSHI